MAKSRSKSSPRDPDDRPAGRSTGSSKKKAARKTAPKATKPSRAQRAEPSRTSKGKAPTRRRAAAAEAPKPPTPKASSAADASLAASAPAAAAPAPSVGALPAPATAPAAASAASTPGPAPSGTAPAARPAPLPGAPGAATPLPGTSPAAPPSPPRGPSPWAAATANGRPPPVSPAPTSASPASTSASPASTSASPASAPGPTAPPTSGGAPPATRGPALASSPLPAAPRVIPPLPDDEEIIPFEEEDEEEPSREPPAGASPKEVLDRVRSGALHVSALNHLSDADLAALATAEGAAPRPGERRSETLYRLLQAPRRPVPAAPETKAVDGLLELHPDGYGFLRRADRNYAQHPEDVYVSGGIVRRFGLKAGHFVSGTAQRVRQDQPFFALQAVEEVNHEDPERVAALTPFDQLTVVYPDQRFLLEVNPDDYEMRVMDLFCPLGRGQRGLVVSPPRAGKTTFLQKLSDAIARNSPEVDIVVLLVDERPEEVTNMRRSVRGEVIASTFDKPAANHVRLAELVMEKVKRMVEFGRHVVLLLDSITRLGRAYNNMAGPSGRILTGGMDAGALTQPKRFFGAARNVEDGGSLTIVATALVDTGSRLDDLVFEEFKGSGNMELVLSRDLANLRIWPAIDIPASGTRNEDLLLHPEELRRVNILRKAMSGLSPADAMEQIRDGLKKFRTNAEFLMSLG